MEDFPNSEIIDSLQSQLESLRKRVQELETENVKVSAMLSNCRCQKIEASSSAQVFDNGHLVEVTENLKLDGNNVMTVNPPKQILQGCTTRTLHHFPKRYVALKVMYFGQRFYGFASEAQMDPTVESEIFKALQKTRLISGDRKELQYSRCGRTDKGVSSVGQVIALFLRSNCKETAASNDYSAELFTKELCEIDYVKMLNRVLPEDIRIIGWSPVPTDFSARFSCLSRQYKYFFWRENLNISAMETAGKKFIGEHDFRNFCKMDAANVQNYKRDITSFEILPFDERYLGDQLWVVQIKGSAFLWHQIRCMVAVLFSIGQGLESPNVIDVLLDVERTPRKPQYKMAPEIPLVLQSCEFEGLKFSCSPEAGRALQAHLEKECQSYKLQAAIFDEALQCLCTQTDDSRQIRTTKKKKSSHIPLILRATEPSYEERRAKLSSGGGRRKGNYGAPHT